MINSDGAAALVLVSGEKALQLGLEVIAKITGYADAAQVTYLNIVKLSKILIHNLQLSNKSKFMNVP